MIKNFLFAAALLSLALASGCATGGGGPCVPGSTGTCPMITLQSTSNGFTPILAAGLNLPITITATFKNVSQGAVNWNITGTSCTGSSPTSPTNPCGYFTSTTTTSANYMAPSSVPSSSEIDIVATLQVDSSVTQSLNLNIINDTVDVAPPAPNVGLGLTQQYTATVAPDQAPQTVTWTCSAGGVPCVNFTAGANGTYLYTPVAAEQCGNGCVLITAAATIDPTACPGTGCVTSKTTAVTSRVSGTYAFQFSGFDSKSNPVIAAGTFTVDSKSGAISGFEDEITSSGLAQYTIAGGAYTPTSSDPNNSNNAGTLTLPTGVFPNTYQVVLDSAGDIQMISTDQSGDSGSGTAEPSSKKFNSGGNQTFAFGFTGVDSSGNRVGYAGLLPMVPGTNGGTITGGLMDVNDGGNSSNSVCSSSSSTPPCPVAGAYSADANVSGLWHLALTSPIAMTFDFFVANGSTNASTPLMLYAISTDSNPAVLGTMAYQNSAITYNNAAFNSASVSTLTGLSTASGVAIPNSSNVSLTLGTTDGTDSATGTGNCPNSGGGNFTGSFNQNNAGTAISVGTFPGLKQSPSPYTYVATNSNTGRFIFCMLGNPGANPVAPPIPVILYASGANRGFLLDQSSPAVMTGTMTPEQGPKQNNGSFSNSLLPGTYAVAPSSNSSSNIAPLTMNLVFTFPGGASSTTASNVGGTQNPPGPAGNVTGTYDVSGNGIGTMGLTAPSTEDYVFYSVDLGNFYMIRDASKDTGVSSSILYVAQ